MDNETSVDVGMQKNRSKTVPLVIIILIVLAVVGYFVLGSSKIKTLVTSNESGITVNGVAVPKSTYDTQYESAVAAYKTQGMDVTSTTTLAQIRAQVIDNLINNELLAQEVAKAGIQSNEADVEKQYQAIVTQTGGADKLKEELIKNKLTDAQLRENIAKQLQAQAYLLQKIDVTKATVTDAEVSSFYAEYSKAQKASGQTVPTLKELSDQIKQKLVADKQNALVTSYITELRSKATIVISPSLQ